MKRLIITVCLTALLFTGCAEMNKAQYGAIGGAAGGALIGQAIGHDTESTLIGAAVGTMLGYIVGNEMDKYDRQTMSSVYNNVQNHDTASWTNQNTGNQYQVTPNNTYHQGNRVCRDAQIKSLIDGREEVVYTTACRNSQGEWELQ